MFTRMTLVVTGVVVALSLGACASARSGAVSEENAVVHQVSAAEEAATHSKEPVMTQKAVLWVNGLGCPQCATNIDFQLKRLRGVNDVTTDLGTS